MKLLEIIIIKTILILYILKLKYTKFLKQISYDKENLKNKWNDLLKLQT